MPAALTYPGVYVEEVKSQVRTIIGVSTSIAAFVGRTKLGPADEPVVINSWGDFERRFGGLWDQSPLSVAVSDFFQNGGGQAVIVRVFAPTVAGESAQAEDSGNSVAAAAQAAVAAAADAQAVADAAKARAGEFQSGTAKVAADAVAKAADDFAKGAGNAAKKQETADAAKAAVVPAVTAAKGEAGKFVARLALEVKDAANAAIGVPLRASSPGTWANDLRARIDVPDPSSGLFTLTVRDGDTEAVEQFANVSLDEASLRRADRVLKRESSLVRFDGDLPGGVAKTGTAPPKPGKQWWEDPANAGDPPSSVGVGTPVASDGVDVSDSIIEGSAAAKSGLHALDKAEEFNMLCIPPHDFANGDIGGGLIDAAIAYCTERRAMLLIDPPSAWTDKDKARAGMDSPDIGSASSNAAIYFPRIVRPSPFLAEAGAARTYVPCGAVAGVIARTDTSRGIWKAPAGLDATLSNAPELSVPLTDAENGELNPKGLNCLRAFPAAGRVVWGARTRRGSDRLADEWKYLPVRRTALYIEESLFRGTKWVVFEPNDEPLWASIRLNVGSFMNQLFRQGAFQGATPRDAYFVRCDRDTTTQPDVDRGVVNILVGFAPLKPAEFVVLRIQQMAGQIQI